MSVVVTAEKAVANWQIPETNAEANAEASADAQPTADVEADAEAKPTKKKK